MNFTISIACDNAAFQETPEIEVARILTNLAKKIEANGLDAVEKLRDINGNVVGSVTIKKDD